MAIITDSIENVPFLSRPIIPLLCQTFVLFASMSTIEHCLPSCICRWAYSLHTTALLHGSVYFSIFFSASSCRVCVCSVSSSQQNNTSQPREVNKQYLWIRMTHYFIVIIAFVLFHFTEPFAFFLTIWLLNSTQDDSTPKRNLHDDTKHCIRLSFTKMD